MNFIKKFKKENFYKFPNDDNYYCPVNDYDVDEFQHESGVLYFINVNDKTVKCGVFTDRGGVSCKEYTQDEYPELFI